MERLEVQQKRHKVYAQLPKAGLGNKLLVWARGYVFAHANNLEFFTGQWWGIHWGAWLRWERQKRLYIGYFKPEGIWKKLKLLWYRKLGKQIVEPKNTIDSNKQVLYIFKELFTDSDYFKELKPWRKEIKAALYAMLSPGIYNQLNSFERPIIGIHVRRGDFKLGSTITPTSFFVDAITTIRELAGATLPVTVFTDAHPEELEALLELPEVAIASPKADILDLLLLSESKICILSISSSFSLWAGFLSDGIVLKHPDEWHPAIRPADVNQICYEGSFKNDEKIKAILDEQLKFNRIY